MCGVTENADVAQARALRAELRRHAWDLASKLSRVESLPDATAWSERARSMRRRARELRQDLDEARFLIERLHARFPSIDATGISADAPNPSY
ncbi:hypothetical protein MAUB_37920 [Mycolicibacterium aubagnense]|uniref:Transposase n=1 Tax=Mycolicibacterium aubagnense TaxID=319707 RepID=A0ABN5YYR6_9MYCO|nr:hypothetical protein C1S80_01805 [Mycolicibacterium aubagnense]BBX85919.1 hypothetical protein MAUB_37920 [Mycolicibacterium aubagnense]